MSAEQPEVSRRSESRVNDEYDLLLRRYGEAMARIGELEAQVQRLGDEKRNVAESDDAAASVTELRPDGNAGPGSELLEQRDRELAKLRSQVTSLSNQLAQAQRQVHEAQSNRRRSGRRRQRSRWKFWRRWTRRY
jgi:DNA repair exonuclease SbcCD ATPase subunit